MLFPTSSCMSNVCGGGHQPSFVLNSSSFQNWSTIIQSAITRSTLEGVNELRICGMILGLGPEQFMATAGHLMTLFGGTLAIIPDYLVRWWGHWKARSEYGKAGRGNLYRKVEMEEIFLCLAFSWSGHVCSGSIKCYRICLTHSAAWDNDK